MVKAFFIFGARYLFWFSVGIALLYLLQQPRSKQKRILKFAAFSLPLSYVVGILARLLYYDPRPFFTGHYLPLVSHQTDNGFPSDHTLLCAAIAAMFFPTDKLVSLTLWLIAAIVAASRVYVGVHHPIDVVGSMVIAITVAWAVFRFMGFGLMPLEKVKWQIIQTRLKKIWLRVR